MRGRAGYSSSQPVADFDHDAVVPRALGREGDAVALQRFLERRQARPTIFARPAPHDPRAEVGHERLVSARVAAILCRNAHLLNPLGMESAELDLAAVEPAADLAPSAHQLDG